MPHIFSFNLLFLCILGFIGSFVDSIAGGGGLITVPAYLFAGFPPHLALGTNKLSATFGSLFSSFSFFKHGKVNFELLKYIIPCTFLGSILGVYSVLHVKPEFLYPLVSILILLVGIYTYFKKDLGLIDSYKLSTKNQVFLGMFFGFIMGFYDGFFGPGTGSFLLFIFIKFFKMDFVKAQGNGKMLNFVSNITSLCTFIISGSLDYFYGIIVGIVMIFGALLGTKVAIKGGAKFVKPLFLIMSLAVFINLVIKQLS